MLPDRFHRREDAQLVVDHDVAPGGIEPLYLIEHLFLVDVDEHPPADVSVGMGIQQDLITALQGSSAWESSAFLLTYDEHGGYFDHVAPPQLDAFGLGIRVPMWVISPQAKAGHIEPTVYEHTSTLKFLERLFNLTTLASVNHRFDTATPGGGNYEAAGGAASVPKAPPRDDNGDLGDLFNAFEF